MKAIAAAFPRRSMHVKSTGQAYPAVWSMAALLLIAFAIFVVFRHGPDILRDWRVSQDAVEVTDSALRDGRCVSKHIYFRSCSGQIAYMANNRRFSEVIDFEYLDVEPPPSLGRVMRSASDPSLATIDVAIDKLWHQVALLLFLLGGAGAFFIHAVVRIRRSSRLHRIFKGFDGKLLRPVPVRVIRVKRSRYLSSTVTYVLDGRPPRIFTTEMGQRPEPFYLNGHPKNRIALAVTDEKGEAALLLDRALTQLDFTDAERTAIRMAARAPAAKAA